MLTSLMKKLALLNKKEYISLRVCVHVRVFKCISMSVCVCVSVSECVSVYVCA